MVIPNPSRVNALHNLHVVGATVVVVVVVVGKIKSKFRNKTSE